MNYIDLTNEIGGSSSANTSLSNINSTAKELIAHLSMPSNTFEDLTLEASGYRYTAPADGFYIIDKVVGSALEYVYMANISDYTGDTLYPTEKIIDASGNYLTNGEAVICKVEAKKGDKVTVIYTATGATRYFKFVYAEGSKI